MVIMLLSMFALFSIPLFSIGACSGNLAPINCHRLFVCSFFLSFFVCVLPPCTIQP